MNEIVDKSELLSDEQLSDSLARGEFNEDWKLTLKWNWFLRPDKKRIIIAEVRERIFEIGEFSKLTPQAGIILALLDGQKTVKTVLQEAAELFEEPPQMIRGLFTQLCKSASKAFTLDPKQKNHRQYDLRQFIIPQNEVDIVSARLSAPLSIILHIADACVRNCIYCNVEKRPTSKTDALTTEQIFNLIDQAATMGVLSMQIAGGEPFMRQDIPEILAYIFKKGIFCGVSTKAFVSLELAQKLKDIGVQYMQVSIDAPRAEIADFLAGSVGFFDDAIQSIKNMRQAGIEVRTNSIITPFNVKLVPELFDLLVSLGVYNIAITAPSRSLHNGAVSDSLFLNHREGKWLEKEMTNLQAKYASSGLEVKPFSYSYDYAWMRTVDKEKNFRTRSYCSAGRSACLILEDGGVVLCEECPAIDELVFGNVKTQSLQEIWDSPRITEFLHPPREKYRGTVCFDCPDYDECHDSKGRCWRESMKAYGKIYAPAPLCPRAPKGKRVN